MNRRHFHPQKTASSGHSRLMGYCFQPPEQASGTVATTNWGMATPFNGNNFSTY